MRQLESSRGPFEVYLQLEPVAKGRPRMTRKGHVYTPEKTRTFEKNAKLLAKKQFWQQPLQGPIAVDLLFYFKAPKKPKHATYVVTRPDLDNLSKSICDAMNGLCWVDDSQIVDLRVRKLYGEFPKVHLVFCELR